VLAQLPEQMLARVQQGRGRPGLDHLHGRCQQRMTWLEQLEREGFAVLRAVAGPGDLERAMGALGVVVHRTAVELRPNVGTYLCKPGAVPFHTDHPDVEWIAWWCEAQDPTDGASLLVDARQLVRNLPLSEREKLRATLLPCPELGERSSGTSRRSHPVVGPDDAIYFAPWLAPPTDQEGAAWRRLVALVGRTTPRRVRLQPGDALVIDNRRTLHGRGPISAASPRRLCRLWVSAA
jgi:hypothetical protein